MIVGSLRPEALAGMHPGTCTMHETCDSYVVVEYNGDIYPCDFFVEGGWKLGDPASYNRELALYTSDCLNYVKTTQPKTWEKYQKLYPNNPEQAFIDKRHVGNLVVDVLYGIVDPRIRLD